MKYTKKKNFTKKKKIKEYSCFVCNKPLSSLIKLRKMKANGREGYPEYLLLQKKVTEKTVRVGNSLLRHQKCEPGSPRYMKSPYAEAYKKLHTYKGLTL